MDANLRDEFMASRRRYFSRQVGKTIIEAMAQADLEYAEIDRRLGYDTGVTQGVVANLTAGKGDNLTIGTVANIFSALGAKLSLYGTERSFGQSRYEDEEIWGAAPGEGDACVEPDNGGNEEPTAFELGAACREMDRQAGRS